MSEAPDDVRLAVLLAEHLHDHPDQLSECVVCQQVMKHMSTWFDRVASIAPEDYDVRVDERGWMVIRHRGCDKRVAEWPKAQGMWPLTIGHVLDEARMHERQEHA